MTRGLLLSLLLVGCLVGCGDTPVSGDEGGTDATVQDGPKADTGSKDGSIDAGKDSASDSPADADIDVDDEGGMIDGGIVLDGGGSPEGGQCVNANDCRLFSSYCSTDPCSCIPLQKNDPDPKCNGMKVTCFIDPCLNKSPWCNNGICDKQ